MTTTTYMILTVLAISYGVQGATFMSRREIGCDDDEGMELACDQWKKQNVCNDPNVITQCRKTCGKCDTTNSTADPCETFQCKNGGTCLTTKSDPPQPSCECSPGYKGKHCQKKNKPGKKCTDVDQCVAPCDHGYKADKNGCQTCHCKTPNAVTNAP